MNIYRLLSMLCTCNQLTVLAVDVARPSSPPGSPPSDVPEESSLWEKLELYEPRKGSIAPACKAEIIFGDGPIAPVYCPHTKGLPPSGNTRFDTLPPFTRLV